MLVVFVQTVHEKPINKIMKQKYFTNICITM